LWKKLVGKNLSLVVYAAHEDPFDADHWWRNTRDVYSVVRETLGLIKCLDELASAVPYFN
jgi:hypothetical protein